MSFNVRNIYGDDGTAQAWTKRRDVTVRAIDNARADVVGMQEAFGEQIDYLLEHVSEPYASIGDSRMGDGTEEYSNIFYRDDKLEVLDTGTFWLSETPDVPASMHSDADWPRISTWGLFQAIDAPDVTFYVFNTHYSHKSSSARLFSSELILRTMGDLASESVPAIVTGDFNCEETSPAFTSFLDAGFADSWTTGGHAYDVEDGTFHGYGGSTSGSHIDWVLLRGLPQVLGTEIVRFKEGSLYPSDHFGVVTDVVVTSSRRSGKSQSGS